jgi:hypothetical protein
MSSVEPLMSKILQSLLCNFSLNEVDIGNTYGQFLAVS